MRQTHISQSADKTGTPRLLQKLALQLGVVCLLLLCPGCPKSGNNGFGQNFMDVSSGSKQTMSDYRYVADSAQHLYWPNTAKYRNKIRRENLVYILDYETLKEFHGYKPGPK